MDGWVEALLEHAAQQALLPLSALLRCGGASRRWREAVRCALPTLRALDFRGCEARVTGPDVLAVLARVAGATLAAVYLANCRRLGAADVEQVLARVAATCPGVAEVDVTGCRTRAIVRAVAVRARDALAAASPLGLYVLLEALRRAGEEEEEEEVEEEEAAGDRCSFRRVCAHLRTLPPPRLVLDPEFAPEENAGDSEWEEEIEGDSDYDSEEDDTPDYLKRLLGKEVSEGSGWAAALLLGVSFGVDDDGDARMCACNAIADHRSGRRVLHVAAERGDADMVALLLRARARVGPEDEDGTTPLLLACRTGHLELATMLLDEGADASAANDQDDTPLLAAVAAGNAQLASVLEDRGAAVAASRLDGASVLALAMLSHDEACIKFALAQRLTGQDTLDVCAVANGLAEAFLDPAQIGAWIRGGAAPRALVGEIGALLSSADLGAAVKAQLEDVRAFLSHHEDMLADRSRWPMPEAEQVVAQLASQEPDATFARVAPGAWDAAMLAGIIRWKNKPQARRWCRQTHTTGGTVHAMTVSPDGSRLAHVAGSWSKVVVRDFQTGFVVLELSGHLDGLTSVSWNNDGTKLASGSMDQTVKRWDLSTGACLLTQYVDGDVNSIQFSPSGDIIAAGCEDGTVQLIDVATAEVTRALSIDAGFGGMHSVSFSPSGDIIAVGRRSGKFYFVDAAAGQVKSSVSVDGEVCSVAYTPDGTKLAAGLGYPSHSMLIFDTQNNEQLCQLKGHRYVLSVCLPLPDFFISKLFF